MYKNISFIIPAYNCADTIQESIDSIYNGNFDNGDEIIVINDASTDNTVEVVNNLKTKYPQIVLLHHNYNKGSAAASRNTGIDYSKNDLIFCLDSDNILDKNIISKLKQYLITEHADAVGFGEIHYFIDKKENVTNKWILNHEITFIDNINNPLVTPCSSGNYLFTKQSWINAGRYNESIGGAYDSWAFGCVQLATGTKMVTMPNSFYYHRHGYNSTYIQEVSKRNTSLTISQIIIPFLNLINPDDVDYIFKSENRETWFEKTNIKPLRLNQNKSENQNSLTKGIKKMFRKL